MPIVSTELQRNMESFASDVTAEVIEKLSKKYEFDVDEAKEFMGIVPVIMQAPKAPKAPKAPIIPLPFCGVVKEDWCQAIQCNYNLYSQCRKEKLDEGDFCKACKKKADNNDGKTPYGLIQERLDGDYKNNKGKSPTNYGNVMKKRDITREMAEAEAEKVGFTIPEEQFETGTKKNSDVPSDTDESTMSSDDEPLEKLVANQDTVTETDVSSSDEETVSKKKKPRKRQTPEEKAASNAKRQKTREDNKKKKAAAAAGEEDESESD